MFNLIIYKFVIELLIMLVMLLLVIFHIYRYFIIIDILYKSISNTNKSSIFHIIEILWNKYPQSPTILHYIFNQILFFYFQDHFFVLNYYFGQCSIMKNIHTIYFQGKKKSFSQLKKSPELSETEIFWFGWYLNRKMRIVWLVETFSVCLQSWT